MCWEIEQGRGRSDSPGCGSQRGLRSRRRQLATHGMSNGLLSHRETSAHSQFKGRAGSHLGRNAINEACHVARDASTYIAFVLLERGCDVLEKGTIDEVLWHSLIIRDGNQFRQQAAYLERSRNLCLEAGRWEGSTTRLQALLEERVNVDHKTWDQKGRTSLHGASLNDKTSACLVLNQHGADIEARDDDENTAFDLAITGGHVDLVQVLLNAGARRLMGRQSFKTRWPL